MPTHDDAAPQLPDGLLDELNEHARVLSAYDQAQAKWTKSLAELQSLLAQIANKTEQMSGEYVSGDNASAKRFSI